MSTLLDAAEQARAELAFCYEQLGPLFTHRAEIGRCLEMLTDALEAHRSRECQGRTLATQLPCPRSAIADSPYCARHGASKESARGRMARRREDRENGAETPIQHTKHA